ncbi:hypothetical protein [Limimaricola soesokkakensis]|uniref:hypothetical protein n=2 Tax=Limimaricola soesokkakensis TaxID=1343159 RepID=UPI003517B89C
MRPAVYWLGVHKTGTTFLQACLEASREALMRHDVRYEALEDFRRTHTRPLLNETEVLHPAPPSDPEHRQLIFDENILGLVQNVVTPLGLYPEGAWRADEMADRLDLEDPHLVLGLRSFAGFLPSLYCEALKATPFQPFRSFLRTPLGTLSWQPLITHLLAAFPHSHLTLYTAEALRGHETSLLSHLLDIPKKELVRADHSERPGFSQRAIEEMVHAYEAGRLTTSEVKRFVRTYPKSSEMPGFDPWTAEERAQLDALYAKDLKVLSEWSRVTLLDPTDL